MDPVTVGAPQGSPVSPLLFVIYIAPLHITIPRGIVISYVDDLAITTASPSYSENASSLRTHFHQVLQIASSLQVSFSVPKTELMHWRLSRQAPPHSTATVSLLGETFHPSSLVRWLGYWLSPSLHSSPHFTKRLALAQGALAILRQLSPPGKGIPPYLNHRLLNSLIFPILSYGADLLVPNQETLHKLEVFWNKAMRWSTNLFSSTPTSILPCEACVLPIRYALQRKRRLAALRIACASPSINPATARLSRNFPSFSKYRAPNSFRRLTVGGSYSPLAWNSSPRKTSGSTTHLPLDALLHSIAHLSLPSTFPEAPSPTQPKDPPSPPAPYLALRQSVSISSFEDWSFNNDAPFYYPYGPTTRPHPFMGLDRFTAGRIHQMRSGKSYLAAHTSWFSPNTPPTCPRCHGAPEDMVHALLQCPSTAHLRSTFMPSVTSLEYDAIVWRSIPHLLELSRFIHAAKINYPPLRNAPSPTYSPDSSPQSPPSSPLLRAATPDSFPLSLGHSNSE